MCLSGRIWPHFPLVAYVWNKIWCYHVDSSVVYDNFRITEEEHATWIVLKMCSSSLCCSNYLVQFVMLTEIDKHNNIIMLCSIISIKNTQCNRLLSLQITVLKLVVKPPIAHRYHHNLFLTCKPPLLVYVCGRPFWEPVLTTYCTRRYLFRR